MSYAARVSAEAASPNRFRRFVALGDSLTEGMCDPDGPAFEYANLAVRGKLMQQIVDQQVPAAVALQPDLVSLIGGGNDVLRRLQMSTRWPRGWRAGWPGCGRPGRTC